jgi:two-component system NtrC family sensor kinase
LAIRESTGRLGLSLAYGMIREHGGKMAVHSIPEEGATFVVELPLREPSPPTIKWPSDELEVVRRQRVLVVDANETNLALLQEIVRHLGHDADGSSSAQQALEKIANRDYDLIVTDVHLPGLDGVYLHQRLMELRPWLAQRMIFISGISLSNEVDVFLGRVGCPLIRKPFSVADIELGMRQALEVRASVVPDH